MITLSFKAPSANKIWLLTEVEDVDELIFRTRGKDFTGRSAIEVVRALERDDNAYRSGGGPIRQYLVWSLNQLGSTVPPRDLAVSDRLEDETLALGYLLMLDEYGVGEMLSESSTKL